MRNGITVTAGTDLRGFTKRVLTIGGVLTTTVADARGVLEFKVDSGEQATVTYEGRVEGQAGGAVAAGERVTVSSGGFLTAASSGDVSIGFAENTAISSGSFGDFVLDFTNVNLIA